MLHRNERNGDAGQATDEWRPDTCGNDYNLRANLALRGVNGLYSSIHHLDPRDAGVGIEGCAALLCYVCHCLCQDGCFP